MRILVTGGTSFIGSALARQLQGHDVRAVGRRDGDIRCSGDVDDAVSGCDSVIHAAYSAAGADPLEMMDTAILGISNVLHACEKHKVRDLMLISSPLADDLGIYGTGKRVSELMAQTWLDIGKLDRVVIPRIFNAYGPGMGSYHVIPQFTLRMLKLARAYGGDIVPFPIRGDAVRSFIYIDDAAAQLRDLFLNSGSGTFDVGVDDPRLITSVAGDIAAILGLRISVPSGSGSPARVPRGVPRAGQTEFSDGLLRTVRWYREHEGEFDGGSF